MSSHHCLWAPDIKWFYLVFISGGIANVGVWTLAITMTLDFGTSDENQLILVQQIHLLHRVRMLAPLFGDGLLTNMVIK
jgi:hypothetical protein